MRAIIVVFGVFALLMMLNPVGHTQDLRATLKGPIFDTAQAALDRAEAEDAEVLAPDHYGRGVARYRKAENVFGSGGDLGRVRDLLDEAVAAFDAAAETAGHAASTLEAAYQARLDALQAQAPEFADKAWQAGESAFSEAVQRLEAGRSRRVERYAEQAEEAYRAAELEAIQVALLDEIEKAIEVAEDAGARRHAHQSYGFARDLLAEAKTALHEDRYDTDRPRTLARQALHYAKHARYVSEVMERIDDGELTLESLLMSWEAEINGMADQLDLAVFFDQGPEAAAGSIREAIAGLSKDGAALRSRNDDQASRMLALEQEIDHLQAELGDQVAAQTRLNRVLAEQQQRAEKIHRVEELFTEGEADVLRAQQRLVIRMIGLNFDSGQGTLKTTHYPLLAKLRTALDEFPDTPIVIEGHTDSYGADQVNQRLSTERAESVAQYLLANNVVSPTQVTAVGYGETKPVANNETTEGRRRNRRIDVVMYPNWQADPAQPGLSGVARM